jgi:hypothetical protein
VTGELLGAGPRRGRADLDARRRALAASSLARHVLTRRDVRLAIEVLQLIDAGSPHVLRRAVELAELACGVKAAAISERHAR